MPLKNVLFTGRKEAESRHGWNDWAVISITEPGFDPADLKRGWNNILRLEFHDAENPLISRVLFNSEDARKIIEFVAQAHRGDSDGILVHCTAGISRSAAVAKFIAHKHDLPFNHNYNEYNKLVYRLLMEVDRNISL